MAYQINLLPWREKERLRYKRSFFILLCVGLLLSVSIQGSILFYLSQQKELQETRNHSLENHIEGLNSELKELHEIGNQHDTILTRLNEVEELQRNRNTTTQLLNLLPEMISGGIYLNKVRMNKRLVEITGVSDSNVRLASMLDKLERSSYISSVDIHSIVSEVDVFDHGMSRFEVSFMLLSSYQGERE